MYILKWLISDSEMGHGNFATDSTSRTVQRNPNASHQQPLDASLSSTLIPEDSQINNNVRITLTNHFINDWLFIICVVYFLRCLFFHIN